ncbi:MAG: pyridoxal phosphate-dependent aminotransferase, partial [Firmicutes bacterium]|nr:pyridoxal phosphate-dependent aminotransferase [Bacillota bacterium]MBQ6685022.1 pyridoxal phosphate-dependent aminotransferase [Bacillota bacterium]MBQ6948573.1 pyridoxal phosphate-dependent aminotransferase [Bacillota bacterium]
MKFSSKIEKCNLSPIRKFYPYQVECKKQGKKIYPLNIGQPDIKTPEAYFEAIKNFSAPVLEYAPSPGIPEMIEAVKNYYHGIGIDYETSDILITTGGSESLQIALNCILDDGDEIIIPEPFYPNYNTFVKTTGATIRPLTTTPEEGYHYADREKIEALINEKTRAIMFTNPGNPTGVVLTPEELKLMVDIAVEHDLFIIGDEVYREFVYGGEPLMSLGQYPEANDNVIIIDSVSKRFSACGARIGTVITRNKELQGHMMKIAQARLSVATLDQVASAALYSVDPSYFDEVRAEYKERRDTLYRKLMEIPGVVCKEPKGAFYVMAKLPVDDTEKFLVWLLTEFEDNKETVMYAPGGGFYATEGKGKDEVRFAYILKKEDLERAMDLLAMGIKKYNETH